MDFSRWCPASAGLLRKVQTAGNLAHAVHMLRGMRVTRWAVLAGMLALMVGLMYVLPLERGRGATSVTREDAASVSAFDGVGTAGRDASVPEPEDSPATLHDLETVTGSLDPHELIGTRVDF